MNEEDETGSSALLLIPASETVLAAGELIVAADCRSALAVPAGLKLPG